ncbi:hypothetical protein sscle_15g106090 [Sclerotinia sclerotiorum 1980 UF-70]|uniref:Uncharacterized protein n=1 Tax=Sclerotinia sclerotiorum (strain ATCC 18683 / 1980 / Ss-1) TaxID=665079 RepID=A0A1D9QLU5_SCLS1|nr:hypothetical protein sscle_15g106090 [Sclerotinia sclerotiorum 1980 UF-70]
MKGYDGVLHMSEGARRASGNVLLAMVLETFINGIAVLCSIRSLENAAESPSGYSIIEIYYQATKSKAGTNALMRTGIIVGFYALFSIRQA